MPECSFCGARMKPGTGLLFVKKEGAIFFFCSRKCEKNLLLLKRKPASLKWTAVFRQGKAALTETVATKAEKAKAGHEKGVPEKKEAAAKPEKQAHKKKRARRKKKKKGD